jgi:hypothetical protein
VDVAVDVAARDLDALLERVRSLAPDARAKLRNAVVAAITDASDAMKQIESARVAIDEKREDWRGKRVTCVADAPDLVAQVDERLAVLDGEAADRDEELAEYRTSLETLRQALVLIDRA